MILVTVGVQVPFDRLIRAVDAWAARNDDHDILAQIGRGGWRPRHMQWTEFLKPDEFRQEVQLSRLVVGHAGIGTILTCLQSARPLIVMPRRAALNETRNDHQVATAQHFSRAPGLRIAMVEGELASCLEEWESISAAAPISSTASAELIATVRRFIETGQIP